MAHKRARILVEGRVQGVYYRASMQQEAERFGLKGWARNMAGGEVEAVVEGEENMIQAFLEWCRQGPPRAAVDTVTVEWETPVGDFDTFYIRR